MKSPCNVLKGISIVMANTFMLSCAGHVLSSAGHVQAVRAPCCVQLLCLFTKTCADFLCYAFCTGMCGSLVLCKLLCGNRHGFGVQKHVCGNMAWMTQKSLFQSQKVYILTEMSILQWMI